MREPDRPSNSRLRKAGIAVVILVFAIVLVIFIGRNLWHARGTAMMIPDMPTETHAPTGATVRA